ncbi:hypothetical protein LSTR_LSTR001561 [Laodelphax striatellus]|uniref:Uncharacterized protein n=1 Tax=Laodelphax striatellus TaxID=195883 RepID=A0A482XCP7_LAOST|nr:hypothetical protein LSTR_LSTR001561 [Laodelphax striatellus]
MPTPTPNVSTMPTEPVPCTSGSQRQMSEQLEISFEFPGLMSEQLEMGIEYPGVEDPIPSPPGSLLPGVQLKEAGEPSVIVLAIQDSEIEIPDSGMTCFIDEVSTPQEAPLMFTDCSLIDKNSTSPGTKQGKPKKEATFFIACRHTKKKTYKRLFKIQEMINKDKATVFSLNPCNRMRTMFAKNRSVLDLMDLSKTDIVTYLPYPLKFGTKGNTKYQFPEPVEVDL